MARFPNMPRLPDRLPGVVPDDPAVRNTLRTQFTRSMAAVMSKSPLFKRVLEDLFASTSSADIELTLREFEGLSYEDIANVMDCPVGTVRSRIFRAREAIDKALKPLLEA